MSIENPDMFKSAKNNSEPEFAEVLKRNGFANVRSGNEDEDKAHNDIFAEKESIEQHFDVKDLEFIKTYRNYSISEAEYNDIKDNPEKYEDHYLACRQYVNGESNGKFIVIPTLSIFPMMFIKTKYTSTGYKNFYLAPVYDYIQSNDNFKILS